MHQGQSLQDADDLYTSFETAITIRKCKAMQQKEKIKLVIRKIKKLDEELKLNKEETERLNKEKEEVDQQTAKLIANIKSAQESRASQQLVLLDLNNKIMLEKAKTKKQSDEFKALIQDAVDTWKSYEKVYKQYPQTKKLEEVKLELRKADIEKKMLMFMFEDMKHQEKLRKEIREKRFYAWGVNLVKMYFTIQEKISENKKLISKKRELESTIVDIESGKNTKEHLMGRKNLLDPLPTQDIQKTQTRLLHLKMPQFPVTSPTLSEDSAPNFSGGRLFDWSALLSPDFIYKRQTRQIEGINKTIDLTAVTADKKQGAKTTTNEIQKTRIYDVPMKEISNTLPLKSSSKVIEKTSIQKNTEHSTGGKRKLGFGGCADEPPQPAKKAATIEPLPNKQIPDISKTKILASNKSELSNPLQHTVPQEKSCEIKKINKENINVPSRLNSSFSGIKELMSSLTATRQSTVPVSQRENSVAQTLGNMLSLKQVNKHISKDSQKPISTEETTSLVNQQTKHQSKSNDNKVCPEDNVFSNENDWMQNENITAVTMDPTSPPDIIPVENTSQSLSQTMITQVSADKVFSQTYSDFMSPSDLTEVEKVHYRKLAAESPEFDYPKRGPELVNLHKSGAETTDSTTRSKYFNNTSLQSETLNTPTSPEEYQTSTPYSPPTAYYLNTGSDNMMNVRSPPAGNLGSFGFGTSEASLFNKPTISDKPSEGGFSFNFMSDAPKSKSIFSLF